ncbi:hypothetical protein GP486_000234 [Trichoglossum hirsutum]|uniref:Uncharacterized protein n=1 Tax=Trichoglossum hirsutum TaxID=265104 RepID=A0A9P8LIZ4_9PEZI|nr:hypothetical protein GP486_000234 [Trichoglossum hirsutum]
MSTPVGLLSPPPPSRTVTSSIVSPGKRKREESNRPTSNMETVEGGERAKFEGFMRDLLEILKRQDTKPSILNHPLSKDPSEPTAKRQKVSEHSTNVTIASKLNLGTYMNWDELVADVEAASSAVLAMFQSKNSLPNGTVSHRHYPPLPDDEGLTASILAFKKTFNSIIARERMQRPPTSDLDVKNEDVADLDGTVVVNGFGGSKSTSFVGGDSRPNGAVLTLYGNAPQPKQLFSSLQEPIRISPTASGDVPGRLSNFDSSASASSVQVITPLREAALPNGISTTQVIPVHSTLPDGKKAPTLGGIFAPPASLPQLNPPKQSKYTTTRGSIVGWYNPSELSLSSRSSRLGTYETQPLSTGQWLTYNAIPPPQSSSEIRRSKRDRSSSDAAKAQLNLEALARHSRAKEDALFRSAYSSFAPSHDDSGAVVPQEVKSRLWWERVGGKRFEQVLAEPYLETVDGLNALACGEAGKDEQDEEELFREAVESWVPEEPPADFRMDEAHKEPKDVDKELDEVLKDISELLETLNSHQRIRNLSLASMSQTAVGQNRQITAMTGSPSSPSSAEMDIYNMIKSQLSALIAGLPPYAVAKLDGEKLAELNVSAKIVVEGKDYKGVMEEDETTARATAIAALSAAAGSATRITGPPVSQYPVQTQYSTPRTSTPQYHQRSASNAQLPSSRPQQGTQQYYQQQQQTPVRPPSSNTQRDPIVTSHASFQHPQRPPSTNSHRVSAGVTAQQSYSPQTPRPTQSPYGQSNSQQYFQQQGTPHGYQQYHGHSQSTAQTPTTSRQFSQPSQPQYQQQAALRQHFAPTQSQYVGARSSSPLKAQQSQQQQRGLNPMSSQTPARPTQYFQQSSQSQYQTPSTLGASGFHTYMSAEQQALLMERQRATLAQQNQQNQQQQARAAAQLNIQRHAVNATLPSVNPQSLQPSQQEYGGPGAQGFTGVQMANSLNQQHTATSGSTVTAGNGR